MMRRLDLMRYLLAGREKTLNGTLWRLVSKGNGKIRCKVAENLGCPTKLLTGLSNDNNKDVRIAVALNPKTDICVLNKLSTDPSLDVRFMIAATSYIPSGILEFLAKDDNPYIQKRAKETLQRLAMAH
jgi:hypothetical protein